MPTWRCLLGVSLCLSRFLEPVIPAKGEPVYQASPPSGHPPHGKGASLLWFGTFFWLPGLKFSSQGPLPLSLFPLFDLSPTYLSACFWSSLCLSWSLSHFIFALLLAPSPPASQPASQACSVLLACWNLYLPAFSNLSPHQTHISLKTFCLTANGMVSVQLDNQSQ